MTQVWVIAWGHTVSIALGRPFRPSQTTMHTSAVPLFLISDSTRSQYLEKAHEFARTCARWRLKCYGFGRRVVST